MTSDREDEDRVTPLIRRCLQSREEAERLLSTLITENRREVELPEGTIRLNEAEHGEFVTRFSAEVEPTIWTSKRAKM